VVIVADVHVPKFRWAQVLEVGDECPVERHQERRPTMVGALVGDERGAVDRHRGFARTGSP
jgi:hypothetical protein